MNTRLLFGLLWLTPTLCFGALSTTTSYFLNVEALTNVTARSAVSGLTGVFTNSITLNGDTRTAWPAGATAGTVINTGASTVGAVPAYTDTTGTNVAPSQLSVTTTNASLPGVFRANGGVFTNGVTAGASTFTGEVTSTLGTITADASALDATATWNAAGVTFSGGKLNITDTASAAGSLLWEWQIGGSPAVTLPKRGAIAFPLSSTTAMTQPGVGNWSGSLGIFGSSGTLAGTVSGTALNLSSTYLLSWNSDTAIGRDGAANTMQGGSDSATASAFTFKGPDGSGTDKVGGAMVITGGASTGTAGGGSLVGRTSLTGAASASSLNAMQDRYRYPAKYIALTDNTISSLFTVTLPATNSVGIAWTCTISAGDATDFQSLTTSGTIDGVAKTTTITTVGTPTAAQTALAGSAGTLSVTYTFVDLGSNVMALRVTADTSLTPTYLRAKLELTGINIHGAGVVINEL